MYFKTQEENYETTLSVSDERLENRFLRVYFDGATGEISSTYDKTTKRQLMGCSLLRSGCLVQSLQLVLAQMKLKPL